MGERQKLILAFDIGTTSLKTSVYAFDGSLRLAAGASAEYSLQLFGNGCAEQNPGDWLAAMNTTVRAVVGKSGINPHEIAGISFCSQMQGLVLVDRSGSALRPAMSYLDSRAAEAKETSAAGGIYSAGPRIEGLPAAKLIRSVQLTGIAPTSVKDPLWKYHWVRIHEPEVFSRVYKYLDVKEYLILRLTGNAVMTRDSACATFMYDNRPGRDCWSEELCRLYGVNLDHLPDIIGSSDIAGELRAEAAEQMGLPAGIPVFGGGGDASLIGLGAGAVKENDIHVYMGTSGWVSALTSKRRLDLRHMIASITGAVPGMYNYFCEQETAGKCMEWVADHLALDEIGIYLDKKRVTDDPESVYGSLFDYLDEVVSGTDAGCDGVLFAPWMHGSRSPFEDPNARGMFFNIGLTTGKRKLIRAVVEGICYNIRWMLESIESRIVGNELIRFAGGVARSEITARILADITGRPVAVAENPQNAGTVGAAMLALIGLGELGGFPEIDSLITVQAVYEPARNHGGIYDRNYGVFRMLYPANKALFSLLNTV